MDRRRPNQMNMLLNPKLHNRHHNYLRRIYNSILSDQSVLLRRRTTTTFRLSNGLYELIWSTLDIWHIRRPMILYMHKMNNNLHNIIISAVRFIIQRPMYHIEWPILSLYSIDVLSFAVYVVGVDLMNENVSWI